ncbi:MAG: hypothetical protein UIB39_06815 [Lachnospiraceae bacterium]|nr:hypothetical protein [Lachnospiraceae bacterium]
MKRFFSSPVHIIALVLAGVLALSAVLYHFLPQWLDLNQSPETAAAAATAQNVPKISREDLDAWAKAQAEAEKQAEEERQALLDDADAFTQAVNDGNFEEALEHLDYLEAMLQIRICGSRSSRPERNCSFPWGAMRRRSRPVRRSLRSMIQTRTGIIII